MRNVTTMRNLENELNEAIEKAKQSENLKSEFLAQISHEIRTPLNVILNYCGYIQDLLDERGHLSGDISNLFSEMNNSSKRLIRTVELILYMSEVQTGSYEYKPKPLDIKADILERICGELRYNAAKKKIDFQMVNHIPKATVYVDPDAIEQVLIHLIDNAIKFTDQGKVVIDIDKNEQDDLTVSIVDTGIGIGEEYLKKLYSIFSQEHQGYTRKYEGTGLGLALVKKFCDMNSVVVEISSIKGEGTSVVLTFSKESQ